MWTNNNSALCLKKTERLIFLILFFFWQSYLFETEEKMWIFLISTALSSNMLWVYICTKSLLYLFCYANGMVCGGEEPKHLCGLFMVACLSLKLYPGANKQLGTWFFFPKMGLTEKQKKNPTEMKGRMLIFLGHYSQFFLLWFMTFLITFMISYLLFTGANKDAQYAYAILIHYFSSQLS